MGKSDDDSDESNNNCWEIFVNLVVGILWIVFSTVPSLYGSKELCVHLRMITFYGGLWFVFSIIIKWMASYFNVNANIKCAASFLKTLTDVAILITVWVFLAQDEDCQALTTFIWVYTWIIVAGVSLAILLIVGYLIYLCCKIANFGKSKGTLQTKQQNLLVLQKREQNLQTIKKNEQNTPTEKGIEV